jgi:hypothetical protein
MVRRHDAAKWVHFFTYDFLLKRLVATEVIDKALSSFKIRCRRMGSFKEIGCPETKCIEEMHCYLGNDEAQTVYDALYETAKNSPDAEARHRAKALIEKHIISRALPLATCACEAENCEDQRRKVVSYSYWRGRRVAIVAVKTKLTCGGPGAGVAPVILEHVAGDALGGGCPSAGHYTFCLRDPGAPNVGVVEIATATQGADKWKEFVKRLTCPKPCDLILIPGPVLPAGKKTACQTFYWFCWLPWDKWDDVVNRPVRNAPPASGAAGAGLVGGAAAQRFVPFDDSRNARAAFSAETKRPSSGTSTRPYPDATSF